ncbi:MAG: response regulator transcription factor [Pedosphaera sp.]|nr:response regulator transcription factor [Pedosphaera sp.]
MSKQTVRAMSAVKVAIKVAIVEDNAGVREKLRKLINREAGVSCVGVYYTAEAALNQLPALPPGLQPDVVLMDINLPGMSGIECTARLKKAIPSVQILMVTVYADYDHIFEALKMGASGYLLKSTEPDELLSAISDILRGGAPMTGQIARKVIDAFRHSPSKIVEEARLTRREEEVLALVAKGYLNKEIAAKLGTSLETVRVHLRNTYEKLHVHSRTEAAACLTSGPRVLLER